MNSVFKLDLPTIEKLTYIALTRYADNNNKAWPKYETLARDVSCGRKRVIEAVKRLVECRLVEKHERKNRTNIYLVYPPEYFCDPLKISSEEEAPGVAETPPLFPGVTVEHPAGSPGTPLECREETPGVSVEHPISTSTSTKENLSPKKTTTEERETQNKNINENEIAAVVKAFKSKGVQVQNAVIRELLSSYDVSAIKGAIQCTDFHASRNPLAVIKKLLSTGNYVMPLEKETPKPPPIQEKEFGDEEAIRQMIREAKEGLRKKLTTPSPAV